MVQLNQVALCVLAIFLPPVAVLAKVGIMSPFLLFVGAPQHHVMIEMVCERIGGGDEDSYEG